jgi:hypothetical protein
MDEMSTGDRLGLRAPFALELSPITAKTKMLVNGGYFGGYVKPANIKAHRRDRRFSRNQSGRREVVVVVRERGGNPVPAVFNSESQAALFIRAGIAKETVVHADEAASWDNLHERFEVKGINHQEAYSLDGACTNMAEEYFSRLRRA